MSKTKSQKGNAGLRTRAFWKLAGLVVCCTGLVDPFGVARATPASAFASTTIGPTVFDEVDAAERIDRREHQQEQGRRAEAPDQRVDDDPVDDPRQPGDRIPP